MEGKSHHHLMQYMREIQSQSITKKLNVKEIIEERRNRALEGLSELAIAFNEPENIVEPVHETTAALEQSTSPPTVNNDPTKPHISRNGL